MQKKSIKCALLSSFTLDPLPGRVNARLASTSVQTEWYVSPYNQYPQQIVDPNSDLAKFEPQIVFFAVAIEDLFYGISSAWSEPQERVAQASERVDELIGLIRMLAEKSPSTVIFVNTLSPLGPSAHAILGSKSRAGLRRLALDANAALAKLSDELPNLHLVYLEEAFADLAAARVTDPRYLYLAKMRLSRDAIDALAGAYSRRILAHAGIRKKCIVVDLDNTMWGGILGEDGMENLLLGDDGPGKAFYDMQKALLDYYETGTLLAICSKNDEAMALKALREHPGMVLRPQHFAAMRINWESKASNLHSLAAELNIGMDSMIFLDDSQFECAEVQKLAPLVTVLTMPKDPSEYPAFVANLPYFDALMATEDDRRRSAMYADERQRKEFKHQAGSLEGFLKGLEIKVAVERADKMLTPRLAQLSQRTNQFNLTTRRYSDSELLALLERDNWRLYSMRAADRFGDSGITGAAFIELIPATQEARLDSFFVSCRVLGRGIESAFMATIMEQLASEGFQIMHAEFLPTEKNSVAKDFLPNHGFERVQENLWHRSTENESHKSPAWISVDVGSRPEPILQS